MGNNRRRAAWRIPAIIHQGEKMYLYASGTVSGAQPHDLVIIFVSSHWAAHKLHQHSSRQMKLDTTKTLYNLYCTELQKLNHFQTKGSLIQSERVQQVESAEVSLVILTSSWTPTSGQELTNWLVPFSTPLNCSFLGGFVCSRQTETFAKYHHQIVANLNANNLSICWQYSTIFGT